MTKQPSESALSAYTILQVSLPPQPSFPKAATHYIYLRPDAPPTPTSDTPRSLFLSNVPVDASEASLRALFKQIGGALVDRVEFEGDEKRGSELVVKGQKWGDEVRKDKKRKRDDNEEGGDEESRNVLPSTWEFKLKKSGSSAVVVFVDRATAVAVVKECVRMAKKKEHVEWKATESLGEKRYRTHHTLTFPPRDILQQKVNAYLSSYQAMESARAAKLKQLRSEPDEDGFITVTRGGRAGPARIEAAQATAEIHKEREKKRIGGAFYRFQTREEAKKRERELKKKFDEDVRRVEDMRSRKGRIRPEE